MATNSILQYPKSKPIKYKNVGYGWDTSHPNNHIQNVYHIDIPLPPHCVTALWVDQQLDFTSNSPRISTTTQGMAFYYEFSGQDDVIDS